MLARRYYIDGIAQLLSRARCTNDRTVGTTGVDGATGGAIAPPSGPAPLYKHRARSRPVSSRPAVVISGQRCGASVRGGAGQGTLCPAHSCHLGSDTD